MVTREQIFKEVYEEIDGVIMEIFNYISQKHRYKLHDLYKPYFKGWTLFGDDIVISMYTFEDHDFYGSCSIPLDEVVNNTWKDYIDSGEWLKEHDRMRKEVAKNYEDDEY